MTDDQWGLIAAAVVLVAGAVLARQVTRAAARGSLRPNHVAGMRTSATMSSPEAWQAGHRAALPWTDTAAAGCLVLAVAAVLLMVADVGLGWSLGVVTVGAVLLLVGALGGGLVAHRVAKRVRAGR